MGGCSINKLDEIVIIYEGPCPHKLSQFKGTMDVGPWLVLGQVQVV